MNSSLSGDQFLMLSNQILLVFLKVVSLTLGYLIVYLGYRLIIAGAKGEFQFSGGAGSLQTALKSVSPGLLFVLLGALLMGYAVGVDKVSSRQGGTEQKIGTKPPPVVLPSKFSLEDSTTKGKKR
jgi:hypothetical protein